MNRIRPRQKRSLGFEGLEGRLTLSTGLGVASPHTHALVMGRPAGSISATFKGHTTIEGTTQTTPDLTGRIGTDQFTGSGTGTTSGKIVQSGDVSLSNSLGTIQLSLETASVTRAGRRTRQAVPIVVTQATGKYAQYTGSTGMLTTWNVPTNPNATSTFAGFLNPA
jgi:hypothetical protein